LPTWWMALRKKASLRSDKHKGAALTTTDSHFPAGNAQTRYSVSPSKAALPLWRWLTTIRMLIVRSQRLWTRSLKLASIFERAAKFLVADLTDDNRGAYWEAGFAEGLGKRVYYTCEGTKFDKVKTHFDTEHLLTIKWIRGDFGTAVDALKSAIRNDFPTEAKQSD
jgi:hypothetical protein